MARQRPRKNAKKRQRPAARGKNHAAAQAHAGRPLKPLSPEWQQRLMEAERLRMAGRIQQAIPSYNNVLSHAPDTPPALMGLAQCLVQLNQVDRGLQLAKKACVNARQHPEYIAVYAELLLAAGRVDEAAREAERVLAGRGDHLGALLTLSQAQEKKHDYEEAFKTVTSALSVAADNDYTAILQGRLLRRLHRLEEANVVFSEVLLRSSLRPDLRQFAVHESAMTLDQLGRYEEAYNAFVQYGEIARSGPTVKRIDVEAWPREISAYRNVISPSFMEKLRGCLAIDDSFDDPVFLVGFPRSGTTMTEQILAAHPRITTTDEEPFLNTVKSLMIREAGERKPIAELLSSLTPPLLMRLRQTYWEAVRQKVGSIEQGCVFIDKLPLNIIDLPLINILFPNARVIVALRDPRDVCLSCFMQDFGLNEAMVHFISLESTVSFYASVMSLYLEVKDAITLSMMEVRYEDTVSDLQAVAGRILNHLGLEWDDRVLRFHEIARSRAISTPSFAAVTEPIHTRAVKRWENYAERFEGVQLVLGPFIEAFGYE